MTHFTDGELRQWSRSGPGTDRERLVAHLAACSACADAYASAIREQSFSPESAGLEDVRDIDAFLEAGYDVPAGRQDVPPFLTPRARILVALAAAAALFVAIALPYMTRSPQPPVESTVRGAGLWALAPVGSVDAGSEFEWSADFTPAAGYRITIGDSTGVVYTERTKQTRSRLTPDAWSRLTPGIDYWWTVTALDAADRIITVSARQTFTIRPRS